MPVSLCGLVGPPLLLPVTKKGFSCDLWFNCSEQAYLAWAAPIASRVRWGAPTLFYAPTALPSFPDFTSKLLEV